MGNLPALSLSLTYYELSFRTEFFGGTFAKFHEPCHATPTRYLMKFGNSVFSLFHSVLSVLSFPFSLDFMAHMSDCGQGRCLRPWWTWPVVWQNTGASETLDQRRSRNQNRTVTRSGEEGWNWTFSTQWKMSVHSAAPLTAALEVRSVFFFVDNNCKLLI